MSLPSYYETTNSPQVIDELYTRDKDTGEYVRVVGASEQDVATWDTLQGKPDIVAAGNTQIEARAAIGAGTSNLTIGNSATTAKAGNDFQNATQTPAEPIRYGIAVTVQGILAELDARVDALETTVNIAPTV